MAGAGGGGGEGGRGTISTNKLKYIVFPTILSDR